MPCSQKLPKLTITQESFLTSPFPIMLTFGNKKFNTIQNTREKRLPEYARSSHYRCYCYLVNLQYDSVICFTCIVKMFEF